MNAQNDDHPAVANVGDGYVAIRQQIRIVGPVHLVRTTAGYRGSVLPDNLARRVIDDDDDVVVYLKHYRSLEI